MISQNNPVNSSGIKTLHYVLQIAIAMCFIGHGAFGIITKEVWCNYFAVFGIGREPSYQLMPVVGIADILLGIVMLIYPMRAIAAWLVFWGLFTALLRPLSHEPFAEFIERAGNYGAPFALLVLAGGMATAKNNWFTKMRPSQYPPVDLNRLLLYLRVIVFLLLLGHGWLNLIQKQGLLNQYKNLGWGDGLQAAQIIGIAEILAAVFILVKPVRPFILVVLIWKMVSETFYLQYPFFEWVERGGSYACILCIWLLLGKKQGAVSR